MTAGAPVPASPARSSRGGIQTLPAFVWVVAAAVVVGLGLRLAWVVYAAHTPAGLYDPARYLYAARGIAQGKGYIGIVGGAPTAYYPPGYPYFLGGVAWVVRLGLPAGVPLVAGIVQACLGSTVVASAAIVARRVWSRAAAGLAAWLIALEPNLIFHTGALLGETLFLALFLASLAVLCSGRGLRNLSARRVLVFAVVFALAFLVRPVSVPVLLAVIVGWWLATRSWRAVLRWTAISVGVLVVLLAPWTIRNAVRMHAFIPVSTNTGDNFCIGNGPHSYGGFGLPAACLGPARSSQEYLTHAVDLEVHHNSYAFNAGWRYFTGHLSREPWLVWRRLDITVVSDHDGLDAVQSYCSPDVARALCQPGAWTMDPGTYHALARLADWYWYVIGVAGTLGLAVLLVARGPGDRRHRGGSSAAEVGVRASRGVRAARVMVALATVGSIVVLLAFFGNARFKVPAVPLLCVAAAVLATHLAGTCRSWWPYGELSATSSGVGRGHRASTR